MANTRVSRASDVFSEGRRSSGHPQSDAPPLQEPLAGYIFVCNAETMEDDLKRQLFGLPQKHHDSVRNIQAGMPIFLYNYTVHQLHGVFEACSGGGLNLEPNATKFPAQVRVRVRDRRAPLDESKFRPYLFHYDGPKFRFELSQTETTNLLRLFGALGPENRQPMAQGAEVEEDGDWETVRPKGRGGQRGQHHLHHAPHTHHGHGLSGASAGGGGSAGGAGAGQAFFRGRRGSPPNLNQPWRSQQASQSSTAPAAHQGPSALGKEGSAPGVPATASAPGPSAGARGSAGAGLAGAAATPPPQAAGRRGPDSSPAGASAGAWNRAAPGDTWSSSSGSEMVSPDISTTGTSSEDRCTGGDHDSMADCNGHHHESMVACNGHHHDEAASDAGSFSGADTDRDLESAGGSAPPPEPQQPPPGAHGQQQQRQQSAPQAEPQEEPAQDAGKAREEVARRGGSAEGSGEESSTQGLLAGGASGADASKGAGPSAAAPGAGPGPAWSIRSENVSFAAVLRRRSEDASATPAAGGPGQSGPPASSLVVLGATAPALGGGGAVTSSAAVRRDLQQAGRHSAPAPAVLSDPSTQQAPRAPPPAGPTGRAGQGTAAPWTHSAGTTTVAPPEAAQAKPSGPPAAPALPRQAASSEASGVAPLGSGAPSSAGSQGTAGSSPPGVAKREPSSDGPQAAQSSGSQEEGWITVSTAPRTTAGGRGPAGRGARPPPADAPSEEAAKGGRGAPRRLSDFGVERVASPGLARGRGSGAPAPSAGVPPTLGADPGGLEAGGTGSRQGAQGTQGQVGPQVGAEAPGQAGAGVAVSDAASRLGIASSQAAAPGPGGAVAKRAVAGTGAEPEATRTDAPPAELKPRRLAWQGNDAAILRKLAEPDPVPTQPRAEAALASAQGKSAGPFVAGKPGAGMSGKPAVHSAAAAGSRGEGQGQGAAPPPKGSPEAADKASSAAPAGEAESAGPRASAVASGATRAQLGAQMGRPLGSTFSGARQVPGRQGQAPQQRQQQSKVQGPEASREQAADAESSASLGPQHPNTPHGGQQQLLQPHLRGQTGSGAQPGSAVGAAGAHGSRGGTGPGGGYSRQGERGSRSSRGRSGQEVPGRGGGGAVRAPPRPQAGAVPEAPPGAMPEPLPGPGPMGFPFTAAALPFSPSAAPFTPLFGPSVGPGAPMAGMGAAPPYMVPVPIGMGVGRGLGMGMGMGLGPIAGYPAFPMPAPQVLLNAAALHHEILEYAEEARPTRDARLSAQRAVLCLQGVVKELWGAQADVEVFGSYATGLALPYSDVDVAVVHAPPPPADSPEVRGLSGARISAPLIRQLAKVLQKQPWCESLYTIETARIPVIKLHCNASYDPSAPPGSPSVRPPVEGAGLGGAGELPDDGEARSTRSLSPALVPSTGMIGPARRETVKMDITIAMSRPKDMPVVDEASKQLAAKLDAAAAAHNGAAAREFVMSRLKQYPALAPLVLLMKSYLHHRGLKDVFTGGLGSFSLTVMLIFYLERAPVSGGGPGGAPAVRLLSTPLDPSTVDAAPFSPLSQATQVPLRSASSTVDGAAPSATTTRETSPSLSSSARGASSSRGSTGGDSTSQGSTRNARAPGPSSAGPTSGASPASSSPPPPVLAQGSSQGALSASATASDADTGVRTSMEPRAATSTGADATRRGSDASAGPTKEAAEGAPREGDANGMRANPEDSAAQAGPASEEPSSSSTAPQPLGGGSLEGAPAARPAGPGVDGAAASGHSESGVGRQQVVGPAQERTGEALSLEVQEGGSGSGSVSGSGSGSGSGAQSGVDAPAVLAKGVLVDGLLASASSVPSPNLGTLLLGFLHLTGLEMDLSKVKLLLQGRDGAPGGVYWQDPGAQPAALWLDDPLKPGFNIASGSFAMWHVQAALREMLTALTAAPSPGGGPRHKGASSPHAGPGGPGDGGEGAPESTAGGTGAQETPDAADKPKACPLLDAAFMLKLPVAVPLTRIPQHK